MLRVSCSRLATATRTPATPCSAPAKRTLRRSSRPQRHVAPAAAGSSSSSDGGVPEINPMRREFSAYTSVDQWKQLDEKVNTYPCLRSFQAIGTADASFQADIVAAVASVTGPVHVECVSSRPSSGGKYTAVRVGPVRVESADQVVQVFANIKQAGGERLKWYM